MKFEETLNTNEQQKSLDQTQEAVAVPQSQEELLETKIENVEKIADQVDDISPAEIAQIEKLGGDESELAKELTPIDEEIKRTKSGFIDRAKNYVVSLATMVASVGNMSGANTDQKVKDKAEANVVYVDNKNDPKLKAYEDSLSLYNGVKKYFKKFDFVAPGKIMSESEMIKDIKKSNPNNRQGEGWHGGVSYGKFKQDVQTGDGFQYPYNTPEEYLKMKKNLNIKPIGFVPELDVVTPQKWDDKLGKVVQNGKPYVRSYTPEISEYDYKAVYKKPVVEIKYKPKPKLTETKLNPKDVLHIPLEKSEANPLANLKQKEIIKAPEKTGYTVRVGEKLFYLSKEDVNKLEADKTTFYNSSEQGNGAEHHLVWRGNEQGQTLQQVAERLGIKLPIAFDTQEQKFDKD